MTMPNRQPNGQPSGTWYAAGWNDTAHGIRMGGGLDVYFAELRAAHKANPTDYSRGAMAAIRYFKRTAKAPARL